MKFQTVEELMVTPGLNPDPHKTSKNYSPDPDVETEEEDHDAGDTPDDDEPVYADDMHRLSLEIRALFDENHGLTAEGYALLAKMDDMGDFV